MTTSVEIQALYGVISSICPVDLPSVIIESEANEVGISCGIDCVHALLLCKVKIV